MYCKQCGQQIPDETRFCPNCGATQGDEAPISASVLDAQPEYGNNAGEYYQPGQTQNVQPPQYTSSGGGRVSNTAYLVWSIIVTLLCCLPLGIPAIVYAAKINTLNDAGDYLGAQDAANKSKTWIIVAGVVGLVVGILSIILYGVGIASYISEFSY